MDLEVMHELDDIRLILNRILPLVGFDAAPCGTPEHPAWMVRWKDPTAPYREKEALLYEDFSSEGQAIAAAIRRGSWA